MTKFSRGGNPVGDHSIIISKAEGFFSQSLRANMSSHPSNRYERALLIGQETSEFSCSSQSEQV
jgi:hypothetical protein